MHSGVVFRVGRLQDIGAVSLRANSRGVDSQPNMEIVTRNSCPIVAPLLRALSWAV